MVTLRSYVAPMSKRAQRQLALEQSALAELLGDQVIADVAIIGRDTFTHEGAAIGMLFQAKNNVLASDLAGQRKRALAREKDAGITEETVTDRRAAKCRSFPRPTTACGRSTRSTTNSTWSRRRGRSSSGSSPWPTASGSLGQSAEFRVARQTMPLDRQDTIFVYFSTAFFEGLAEPAIPGRAGPADEVGHRYGAACSSPGWPRLARGCAATRSEDLVAAGLLPPGFGRRPDGSGPIAHRHGPARLAPRRTRRFSCRFPT